MDKYDHWLGKIVGKLNKKDLYCITLGQTSYYSCDESLVTPRWRRHEDCHKAQWKNEGRIRFFCKYMWYSVTVGYDKNPYELDAKESEELV